MNKEYLVWSVAIILGLFVLSRFFEVDVDVEFFTSSFKRYCLHF